MPLSINPTNSDNHNDYQRKLDILTQYTHLFQSYAKSKSNLKENELLEMIDHIQEYVRYTVNSIFYTSHRNQINTYYIAFFARKSEYDSQALLKQITVHLTNSEFQSLNKKLSKELSNSTVVTYQVNNSKAVYSDDQYQQYIRLVDAVAQAATLEHILASSALTNELIQTKSIDDMPLIKAYLANSESLSFVDAIDASIFIASIKSFLI